MFRTMLPLFLIFTCSPAIAGNFFPSGYPNEICPIVQNEIPGTETDSCTETTDSWWEARAGESSSLPILAASDNNGDIRYEVSQWFINDVKYGARCLNGNTNACFPLMPSDTIYMGSINTGCSGKTPYSIITGSGQSNYSDHSPFSFSTSSTTMELVIGIMVNLDFSPGQSCSANSKKMEIYPVDESPNGNVFVSLSAKCAAGQFLHSYSYDWDPYQDEEVVFWCSASPSNPQNLPFNGTSGLDSDRQGCTYGCNPVDLVSGAKLDYVVDYTNYSPFPIVWDRRYDSRQKCVGCLLELFMVHE